MFEIIGKIFVVCLLAVPISEIFIFFIRRYLKRIDGYSMFYRAWAEYLTNKAKETTDEK